MNKWQQLINAIYKNIVYLIKAPEIFPQFVQNVFYLQTDVKETGKPRVQCPNWLIRQISPYSRSTIALGKLKRISLKGEHISVPQNDPAWFPTSLVGPCATILLQNDLQSHFIFNEGAKTLINMLHKKKPRAFCFQF